MRTETIQAPTMAEALKEVKARFGGDAVILQTRTLTQRHWLGLRRRQVVEVTAGKGMNVPSRRTPPSRGPVQASVPAAGGVPADRVRAAYVGSGSTPATPAAPGKPGAALMESPAVGAIAVMKFSQEIEGLKSTVNKLVSEVRTRGAPQVPEALFDHYMQLVQAEVAEELAGDIVRAVERAGRPEQFANPVWVRERLAEQIEKLIPVAGPIERKKNVGPHIVALVGPTGVGKTTTIAKLAANLKLREKRRVGLITLDTYRIAAIDQLRRYADLIGITLTVVGSPEEIPTALEGFHDCEYVLIDTAGRSPNDTMKLNELARFLDAAKPDEVHLVLSTTCGPRAAELAVERFGKLRVDKVIFTKIDEAAQVGALLTAVRKINRGLSYVTTGQDVPDDIEPGHGKRLARMILGGEQ